MENTYQLTDKDILLIDTFEDATRRGFYISGKSVFELYNRVFNTNLRPTSCGTCIKHRIKDLIAFKNQMLEELKKQEELAKAAEQEQPTEPTPKKRGRKPKSND